MELGAWSIAAPAVGAAFAASLVEVVEAFTIVLAVASLRGWRLAAAGTGAALVALGLLVAALGPLLERVPLHLLQVTIGVLLLLFGMGWLRKAVLRSAAVIPLHDEDAAFAAETRELAAEPRAGRHRSTGSPASRSSRRCCSKAWRWSSSCSRSARARAALARQPGRACRFRRRARGRRRGPPAARPRAREHAQVRRRRDALGVRRVLDRRGLGVRWPEQDLTLLVFAALFLATGLLTASRLRRTALATAQ